MKGGPIVWIAVLFVFSALVGSAHAGCASGPPHVEMTGPEGTPIKVLLNVKPREIAVSTPFELHVSTCAARAVSIDRVTIDATMPRHRHGMNYLPALKKTANDSYTASGMLFHMPGLWRVEVAVTAEGKTQRFFQDFEVE